MTNTEMWANLSDRAVMSAAVVYALAVLGYLLEWALVRRLPAVGVTTTSAPRQVLVMHRVSIPQGTDPTLSSADNGRLASDAGGGFWTEFAGRSGLALTVVAAGLHLVALVTRALAAGRVPWGNMYEFALAGSFGAVALYLVLVPLLRVQWLGLPVTSVVLVVLMVASLTLYVPAGPLVPALQSYWLVIHVVAAITATGAFTLGALTSLLYLLQARAESRRPISLSRHAGRLPSAERIDQISYRVHAFGFPVWTFAALIAGPIWAKYAWGRYWGWDPKEVWAFITWVVYASYLHARATGGWQGRRAAAVALIGFGTVLFNFVGINMFGSGLHSYSGL